MLTQEQVDAICDFIDIKMNLIRANNDDVDRKLIAEKLSNFSEFEKINENTVGYGKDLNTVLDIKKICFLKNLNGLDSQTSKLLDGASLEDIEHCAKSYLKLKLDYFHLNYPKQIIENTFKENYLKNVTHSKNIQEQNEINYANQKKMRIALGDIFPEEIKEWIEKSLFKDEIEAAQAIAKNLDHVWISGGKEKAQKIRTALDYAIKAAIISEVTKNVTLFQSFQEFKDYDPDSKMIHAHTKKPSLTNALDSRRYSFWDERLDNEKTQSTEKMLEAEREKWILAQGPELQQEIRRIQYHIGRLNSRLLPGGKDKAKQIQDALNRAIDSARAEKKSNENQHVTFKNIKEFQDFKLNDAESLDHALAVKRPSFFNKSDKEAESVKGEIPKGKKQK